MVASTSVAVTIHNQVELEESTRAVPLNAMPIIISDFNFSTASD